VVENGPPAPSHVPLAGSGLGLIGMRERAALFGIAEAVRVVAASEAILAPSVTQRLIGAFAALPPALLDHPPGPSAGPDRVNPLDALTRRELEVLLLVARGLSNARIAESLGLSEAGVKSRVNRILTRLGLENRVQAAILKPGVYCGGGHFPGCAACAIAPPIEGVH
jgi:DNA-binding NarL/FixJ family response regulator